MRTDLENNAACLFCEIHPNSKVNVWSMCSSDHPITRLTYKKNSQSPFTSPAKHTLHLLLVCEEDCNHPKFPLRDRHCYQQWLHLQLFYKTSARQLVMATGRFTNSECQHIGLGLYWKQHWRLLVKLTQWFCRLFLTTCQSVESKTPLIIPGLTPRNCCIW